MPTNIIIIGQGGHSKVVCDTLIRLNHKIVNIFDDNPKETVFSIFKNIQTKFPPQDISNYPAWHVAIGDNTSRLKVIEKYSSDRERLFSVISDAANVSGYSSISNGCFVAPNSVVGIDSVIGMGCIINHGAVIDHDCFIENGVHIAPNSTLGGNVKIGEATFVGAGSTILPGRQIGKNVVIGAGAVVTTDIPNNKKVIGIPGRYK